MTNRHEYKEALGRLDKDTRVCFKYLEKLIIDKFNLSLGDQPPTPKVDLSKIESQLDSLQKQIDGLKPKIEAGYTLAQDHDEQEKYLKKLTKNVEELIELATENLKEQYESGNIREGIKRKFREEGLFRRKKE